MGEGSKRGQNSLIIYEAFVSQDTSVARDVKFAPGQVEYFSLVHPVSNTQLYQMEKDYSAYLNF